MVFWTGQPPQETMASGMVEANKNRLAIEILIQEQGIKHNRTADNVIDTIGHIEASIKNLID